MNFLEARGAIELVAKRQGVSVEEMIREIDFAIKEAMQNPDPLVQARWKYVPHSGERPTALEFVAYMRGIVHGRQ